MSDISFWSPIDDNNQEAPPDGFPEGMAAPAYNDSARAIMGSVRRQWDDRDWFWNGDVVTFVTGTSFSVPGDQTSVYTVGRRIRAVGSLTGTIYGTIDSADFVTVTTVQVTWDAGNLANESDIQCATGIDPDALNALQASELEVPRAWGVQQTSTSADGTAIAWDMSQYTVVRHECNAAGSTIGVTVSNPVVGAMYSLMLIRGFGFAADYSLSGVSQLSPVSSTGPVESQNSGTSATISTFQCVSPGILVLVAQENYT